MSADRSEFAHQRQAVLAGQTHVHDHHIGTMTGNRHAGSPNVAHGARPHAFPGQVLDQCRPQATVGIHYQNARNLEIVTLHRIASVP